MKNIYIIGLPALLSFGLMTSVFAYEDQAKMDRKIKAFDLISIEEAKKIALEAKSGVITDLEIDDIENAGGWKYEAEIADENGHEWDVDINAKTGEVINLRRN